jgi:uncharacterized repeat protein (TIGR01451 family)
MHSTLDSFSEAIPGELVTYAITFGNRGGAAGLSAQLVHTLPAELTFVSASVPPSVTGAELIWDLGALEAKNGPITLVVTATVSPDALAFTTVLADIMINTSSPEIELSNNAATVAVYIVYYAYLPLVFK